MELYSETIDPSETKYYAWNWSDKLAEGETVTSHTVSFIDAAGTTSPSDSVASNISKVWLAGGTAGRRVIWTIIAHTSQGRDLDVALAVDVVENSATGAGDSEVERITAELVAARAMRAKISAGEAIIELWRDGRRVRKQVPSMADLTDHIRVLEQELAGATSVASGRPRRRAIGLAWSN